MSLFKKIIGLVAVFSAILVLHDFLLYPQLTAGVTLFTSFLRLAVLVLTVCITILIPKAWPERKVAGALFIGLWIFIIPYSFYNIAQVRHIAEACRVPAGLYFTDVCNNQLWRILLPFSYAAGSLGVFFFCVYYLQSFLQGVRRSVFLLSTFAYVAFATVVGIYSRLDTFSLFINFKDTLLLLRFLVVYPVFWFNVFGFFMFAALVFAGIKSFLHYDWSKR